jgi:hypothetical protein
VKIMTAPSIIRATVPFDKQDKGCAQLAVYVVLVRDTRAKPQSVPRDVFNWIDTAQDNNARDQALRVADQMRTVGLQVAFYRVMVPSRRANPSSCAVAHALALDGIGGERAEAITSMRTTRVTAFEALRIPQSQAHDNLRAFELDFATGDTSPLGRRVLLLARRAALGDPHAIFALSELGALDMDDAIDGQPDRPALDAATN